MYQFVTYFSNNNCINKNHGDVMVSTWYVEHSKQVVDE